MQAGWKINNMYASKESLRIRKSKVIFVTDNYGGGKGHNVIIPENCTDWIVMDFDGLQTFLYIKNGLILDEDGEHVGMFEL